MLIWKELINKSTMLRKYHDMIIQGSLHETRPIFMPDVCNKKRRGCVRFASVKMDELSSKNRQRVGEKMARDLVGVQEGFS